MADAIERQIERFAPGFRDCIRARSVMSPADLEKQVSVEEMADLLEYIKSAH